ALPCDRNDASAGGAARKEIDRCADAPVATPLRQKRLECHVRRNLDNGRVRSRDDNSALGVERRRYLCAAANRRVAVAFEQSGDLNRVSSQPLLRRGAWNGRQDERREKRDDRKHAHDLDQGKSGPGVRLRHYREALLIRLWESPTPPAP